MAHQPAPRGCRGRQGLRFEKAPSWDTQNKKGAGTSQKRATKKVKGNKPIVEPNINLKKMRKEQQVKRRMEVNLYREERSGIINRRFWNETQSVIYVDIVAAKVHRIVRQKAIDFAYIKVNDHYFHGVFEACERPNLAKIMEFMENYSDELIM